MVANSVLLRHNNEIEGAGQDYFFFWYPKARIDLKSIHDENDVLTDNELIAARDFLKKAKYACLYIQNEVPRGFKLLNHIRGDYFNEPNRTHLTLTSYPKMSDVVEMKGFPILGHPSCDSLW